MLRRLAGPSLVIVAVLLAGAVGSAMQQSADDVVALERMALDRWGKGDVEGFLSIYADDVTYFDPYQDHRIDGRAAMRALYGKFAGTFSIDRYEMQNIKAQRFGDISLLTYNIQNYKRQPDGTERPLNRWNVTEVFQRIDGKWRTIHSHFSYTKPDIRAASTQ